VKAYLLAAGKGSRLQPLTNLLPKPLVPFLNHPLVSYQHYNLLAHVEQVRGAAHALEDGRPIEAAEAIGIGRSKVYELLASGELPSIRIGGSVRVPLEQLRAWIEKKSAEAGQ